MAANPAQLWLLSLLIHLHGLLTVDLAGRHWYLDIHLVFSCLEYEYDIAVALSGVVQLLHEPLGVSLDDFVDSWRQAELHLLVGHRALIDSTLHGLQVAVASSDSIRSQAFLGCPLLGLHLRDQLLVLDLLLHVLLAGFHSQLAGPLPSHSLRRLHLGRLYWGCSLGSCGSWVVLSSCCACGLVCRC